MSEFNIGGFQSLINSGSRPNLFEVNLGSRTGSLASFLVTAASLPGRTVGTASVFYRGREYKLAGDMVFAPWTTTIINDSNLVLRSVLENWMNESIENTDTKTAPGNPEGVPTGYFDDLIVNQLDRSGQVIRSYRLVNAWPSDISEVGLSFDANDQISSFTCTWQYQTIIVSTVPGEEAPPSDAQAEGVVADLGENF